MNIRKLHCIITAMTSIFLLTGCSQTKSSNPSTERNIIMEVQSVSDFAYVEHSFQELYEDAKFVAELLVTSSEGKRHETGNYIYTDFTADIVTLYKGDYHGEAFHADGAYIQGPDGWVHYNEEESHIPETGERILFFGNYSEVNGEKFINPPAIGQSIFVYDNDSLSITFSYDRNPLLLELQENYGAEIVYDERSVATAVCNAEKLETALQFFPVPLTKQPASMKCGCYPISITCPLQCRNCITNPISLPPFR